MSTTDWDAEFTKIKQETPEFYPGSTKAIIRHPNRVETPRRRHYGADPEWDAKPRIYPTDSGPVEFFTVGQLARALGRQAVTIRKWERDGIIPKAMYQVPGRDGSVHGRRRLYTRVQVEGIVRIAEEEGLFAESNKSFASTRFTERVTELFKANA